MKNLGAFFLGRGGKFQAAWTPPTTMNLGAKNFSFQIIFHITLFPIGGVAAWHKLGKI
jgi:hypothetical protein